MNTLSKRLCLQAIGLAAKTPAEQPYNRIARNTMAPILTIDILTIGFGTVSHCTMAYCAARPASWAPRPWMRLHSSQSIGTAPIERGSNSGSFRTREFRVQGYSGRKFFDSVGPDFARCHATASVQRASV